MQLPVNTTAFWKDRLEKAKGAYRHFSVFIVNPPLWKKINEDHQIILDNEILSTDKVLDCGCGYGRLSEMIKGEYTGIDFSPDFIDEARKLYPDKRFMIGSLDYIPFIDNHFDVAVVVSVKAMIIANIGIDAWDKMEKEITRVAKKTLILEYGSGDALSKMNAHEYEKL